MLALPTVAAPHSPAPSPTANQETDPFQQLRPLVQFDDLRALRAFFERVDVSGVATGVSRSASAVPLTMDAALSAMPTDWEAPLLFVQGAIRHVPYSGSVRGARGTLEAGSGNALDQALLLQRLLEARGVPARLVRGRLRWEDAALLAVGTPSPEAPRNDDPWPRWLEAAADHWWVQAQADDGWVDLDPSFPSSLPGETPGTDPAVQERVPEGLRAAVDVSLRRGDLVLAEVTLPADAVVGQSIDLSFTARSERVVALWDSSERAARRFGYSAYDLARALGWTRTKLARSSPRPSAFQRILLDPEAGPWIARLEVPGRTIEAGPFERSDLDSLELQISVRAPLVPAHVLRAPWGGGADGRLSVVLAAGRVSDARLALEAEPFYRSINRLATLEQEARSAMTPPVQYRSASDSLGAGARDGWDAFSRHAPRVLGWAVLQGVDRVSEASPSGRVIRQGLRLAAVRWRPVAGSGSGSMEIRLSDPVTIGALRGQASAASLRAANGVLQSAVVSQVLNRVAERAPETAFDVTLRAIGTRRPLAAYRDTAQLPTTWPEAVRAQASASLRFGYAVLAPETLDDGAPGWWHVGIFDGETLGWVPAAQGAWHGRVDMDAPVRIDDLESLLASLPALHRAFRWLADLPGSGAMALSSVPAAACASAAVAAEVMGASAEDPWPRPDVPALCGR